MKFLHAFLITSICMVGAAQAETIRWTLQDALLSDGQSVTGSFDYETVSGDFSNISIFNSGTATWAATEFTQTVDSVSVIPPVDCQTHACVFLPDGATTGSIALEIVWDNYPGYLSEAGTLDLLYGTWSLWRCDNSDCSGLVFPGGAAVEFVDGSISGVVVSAVPIPAAVWLFGSALAGLGWLRRKRAV